MPHILLIDDDSKLTTPLRSSFERAGYDVSVAPDGHTGLSKALVENPDVIVLDVMMPGLDGWTVCKAIRERSPVPIIMLTALDDSTDRIRGLDLGADDYLTKPFHLAELNSRIKALLRRRKFKGATTVSFQEIEIFPDEGSVTIAGLPIILTKKEFEKTRKKYLDI